MLYPVELLGRVRVILTQGETGVKKSSLEQGHVWRRQRRFQFPPGAEKSSQPHTERKNVVTDALPRIPKIWIVQSMLAG
jgi:hypothetical protein